MRRRIAWLLAAATGIAILLLAMLFAQLQSRRSIAPSPAAAVEPAPPVAGEPETGKLLVNGAATPLDAARLDRGRQVYREQRCASCHSLAGAGNRRHPLDGVGGRLSPETIRRWIVDPQSLDPQVRKPDYGDLPADDLEALVAYLVSRRGPSGAND